MTFNAVRMFDNLVNLSEVPTNPVDKPLSVDLDDKDEVIEKLREMEVQIDDVDEFETLKDLLLWHEEANHPIQQALENLSCSARN